MGSTSRVTGVVALLLLVGVMTQAAHSTPPPGSGPRLQTKDSNVLHVECRVPYYTAWSQGWDIPTVDLQVSYQGVGDGDKPEVIARMVSQATTPITYGRFKSDSLIRVVGQRIAEADEHERVCRSCRVLVVLMPKRSTFNLSGTYHCRAIYNTDMVHVDSVLVNETFLEKSRIKTNGTLTVRNIKAHDIKITWNDKRGRHSETANIIVKRTVVDSNERPVEGSSPVVVFYETINDHRVMIKDEGTLLYSISGLRNRTLILFVETDLFCFPHCIYSWNVPGQISPAGTTPAVTEFNTTAHPANTATSTSLTPKNECLEYPYSVATWCLLVSCVVLLIIIAVIFLVPWLCKIKMNKKKTRSNCSFPEHQIQSEMNPLVDQSLATGNVTTTNDSATNEAVATTNASTQTENVTTTNASTTTDVITTTDVPTTTDNATTANASTLTENVATTNALTTTENVTTTNASTATEDVTTGVSTNEAMNTPTEDTIGDIPVTDKGLSQLSVSVSDAEGIRRPAMKRSAPK